MERPVPPWRWEKGPPASDVAVPQQPRSSSLVRNQTLGLSGSASGTDSTQAGLGFCCLRQRSLTSLPSGGAKGSAWGLLLALPLPQIDWMAVCLG
uniref:Uncharacterized protein n=1 Tax=Sphaerodactylus townsendi TaxID=933632 RepID=A0ACB8ENH1_9SAUR